MQSVIEVLKRFHEDDDGAPEMSNVLIVALIAIPLIIALIIFGRWAYEQFTDAQADLEGETIDVQ